VSGKQLWLDNARVWALPLALLVVGAAGLAAYQVAFADRVGALNAAVPRRRAHEVTTHRRATGRAGGAAPRSRRLTPAAPSALRSPVGDGLPR
jgi:hypothetical protein